MNMTTTVKGVTYDSHTGEVLKCLFCRIQSGQEPGRIVYEDERFVVFHTIKPASRLHLLVTPREHIKNVRSLKGWEGADLVEDLVKAGRAALGADAEGAKYCFHIPPYNSIDHLHLHAIADPSNMTFTGKIKYSVNQWYCDSAEQVVERLRREGGRRVFRPASNLAHCPESSWQPHEAEA